MFNRKKNKIRQLNQQVQKLEELKIKLEQEKQNHTRCQSYPPFQLDEENIIVIDELTTSKTPSIYIYQVERPIEKWMFLLNDTLGSKSWAALIGKVECDRPVHSQVYIQKLLVTPDYRHQGIATYLMQRLLDWGNTEQITSFSLTAQANPTRTENELIQTELLNFYFDLGFQPIKTNSNQLAYYCY
ncbi:MAG: GNAT family N-acetyltransferase [Enterococcus sp.]